MIVGGGAGTTISMRRSYCVIAAAALTILANGCDTQSCTLIGCGPLVALELRGTQTEQLAEAEYEIALDFDGQVYRTTCAYEGAQLGCTPVDGPDEDGISVFVEGFDGTVSVEVNGTDEPVQMGVEVTADGMLVVDQMQVLTYETTTPNGEGCGECRSARLETLVPEA